MSSSSTAYRPSFNAPQTPSIFTPPPTVLSEFVSPSIAYPGYPWAGGSHPPSIPPQFSDIPAINPTNVFVPVPSTPIIFQPKTALQMATERPTAVPNFYTPAITFHPLPLSWVQQHLQHIGSLPQVPQAFPYLVEDLTNEPFKDHLYAQAKDLMVSIPEHNQPIKVCLGHEYHTFVSGKHVRDKIREKAGEIQAKHDNDPNFKSCRTEAKKVSKGVYVINIWTSHVQDCSSCDHFEQQLKEVPEHEIPLCEYIDQIEEEWKAEGLNPDEEWAKYQSKWDEKALGELNTVLEDPNSYFSDYYADALPGLNQAIEQDPCNPKNYLERSQSHFELDNYQASIDDFKQYEQLKPARDSNVSLNFCKGCYQGIKEGLRDSADGWTNLLMDLTTHPIRTAGLIMDALNELSNLALSGDWGGLAETLSPEAYQLATQWENLNALEKGRLGGHLAAKLGADIFVGGGVSAIAAKGFKGASKLAHISKTLKTAEHTLVLESASTLGPKAAEVMQVNQKVVVAGKEAGLSARQMFKLKEAGKLNGSLNEAYENIFPSVAARQSFELFYKAEEPLKTFGKKFMPEMEIREIIQRTGLETFPRPPGVPENFLVRLADKPGGMEYVHPTNTHIRVRVMPGKPHSPWPYQQKPYVIQMRDGYALDIFGNKISRDLPEAHIPIDKFTYRE